MMKKTKIIILISVLFLVLISLGVFYYQAAIGFGKASVKTIESVLEIKSDLKKKNINFKDSIEIKIDSIKKTNVTRDSINGKWFCNKCCRLEIF